MPEKNNIEIKKDMTVAKILEIAPKSIEVFYKHGMHCMGCPVASGETLEDASKVHGIDPDEIIQEIRAAAV